MAAEDASTPHRMSLLAQALIMSPAVILVLSATRLIVICNDDTTNAATIATSGGVTGTLLGTIVPLLPPYLPAVALVLLLFNRFFLAVVTAGAAAFVSPAYMSATKGLHIAATKFPQLLGLAWGGQWSALWHEAGPKIVVFMAISLVFAIVEIRVWFSGWENHPVLEGLLRFVGGLMVAAVCLFGLLFVQAVYRVPFDPAHGFQVVRRPWMPAEEIALKDGSVIVGYTISSKDGWFLILKDEDRTIQYVLADSVTDRRVCTPKRDQIEYHDPLLKSKDAQEPKTRPCPTKIDQKTPGDGSPSATKREGT